MNGLCSLLIRAVLTLVVLAACVAPAVAQEVVEYIHTDALGSPVAITDASGNVIERTVYEPYGAVVNRPLKDGPGYTGHVTDSGTGLSYMQQRYYDPEASAFHSVDPVAATEVAFGRYHYAQSNPYAFTDPDGRQACGKDTGCRLDKGGERGGSIGGSRISAGNRNSEPSIPPAGSMGELIENTGERAIRRTSFTASGSLALGLGAEATATKTTRPWQSDRLGVYKVMGLGGFIGAQANFKVFSWGDPKGTTDLALKGNPLGYFKVRIGDGLAIGLSARFNDHGGGSLSVSAGGGFGGQAIVKPPAMGGWEKEL